jgi:hypothetical protein
MARTDSLDRTAEELAEQGADGLRLELVRRARSFKRTWVDMAEALVRVRTQGAYKAWGYQDFHAYCAVELQLKQATVEKLTGSFSALERHAPNVLDRDGLAKQIPAMDCVDYFARALADPASLPAKERSQRAATPPPEVMDDLRKAVFEEQLPVSQLRKKFDPILKPKTEDDARLEHLHKTSASVRRLAQLLETADFVEDDRKKQLLADLEALSGELDAAAPKLAQSAA